MLRAQKKPWYYEMSVIFSKEARQERARKLKEESTRGRFHGACRKAPACIAQAGASSCAHACSCALSCAELNEIKENGGKLFEADMDLLKLEDARAITFPDVDAWPLVVPGGGEPQSAESVSQRLAGKVSLVTVHAPPPRPWALTRHA